MKREIIISKIDKIDPKLFYLGGDEDMISKLESH